MGSTKLEEYPIPPKLELWLKREHNSQTSAEFEEKFGVGDLDFSNYSDFLHNLLYIEEYKQHVDISRYTMRDVIVRKDFGSKLFRIGVPGLEEGRPSVLNGDTIIAVVKELDDLTSRHKEGWVRVVERNHVLVSFPYRLAVRDSFIATIKFTLNRFKVKTEHRAVEMAGKERNLRKVLFPTKHDCRSTCTPSLALEYNTEVNKEQKTAIRHIVAGTSRPAPYILYGPPGTGKTHTFVEAIKQVLETYEHAKILACAPHNLAADAIAERLIQHCHNNNCPIMRFNSLSRSSEDLSEELLDISNAHPGLTKKRKMYIPECSELYRKQVIVSTLVNTGRLVTIGLSDHFTHIFIDEAGYATESETLIPLTGLLNNSMEFGGQIILAGDPKQLGPVIFSNLARELLFDRSLMERLMEGELYSRDGSGKYNPNFITKLVRSFRSHPCILEVPNQCFYDGELQAHADEESRNRFCLWKYLPEAGFPMIFHHVDGDDMQDASSPSWYNADEVSVVCRYVRRLMASKRPVVTSDLIGIISPYRQQVAKVQLALKQLSERSSHVKEVDKIRIGSVEKLQGDEREVIIISTVRSGNGNGRLDFIYNPRRFNVAVTRAKTLLIVIGNSKMLEQDENWHRLIRHIKRGGGYVRGFTSEDVLANMMQRINIRG